MDMGLALRVAHPCERAVREGDFQPVAVEQQGPELRDLLALRDRIRGDEADARLGPTQILTGLDKPGTDIIERSCSFVLSANYSAHLNALLRRLIALPPERRIAENVRAFFGCEHVCPIRLQRVGINNVRRCL